MYQIANIIYIYIIIIILLILFNMWYVGKEKTMNILNKRKKKEYIKKINTELENIKDKKEVSEKHKDYFQRKLKITNNLIVFESIINDLKDNPVMESYLIEMSSVFQKLAISYQKKDSIHKAYYAHMLLSLPKITNSDDDLISQTMLRFATDKSIYCRENAMLFLYQNGSANLVVEALRSINNRNLYYNNKLLTDDLLKFNGSHNALALLLLEYFDEFSTNIQVSIINYLRFIKEDEIEELYEKYMSHKYDKEVELAIIRYFSKHKYRPMLDEMIKLVEDNDVQNYEYRIVTTSALASYDLKKTRSSLINCLSDINWYVRKNAATSLSRMSLTESEIELLMKLKDPYAKDMLEYIWEEEGKTLSSNIKRDKVKKDKKKKRKKGELKHVSVH